MPTWPVVVAFLIVGWSALTAALESTRAASQDRVEQAKLTLRALKVAGSFVAGAALLGGLAYTAATFRLSQQGQFTDRFTHAVDQLGSVTPSGDPNVEVRIGGIYALERLARDSQRDSGTIIDILSAYVRRNTPWHGNIGPPPDPCEANRSNEGKGTHPRADIQAALTVIGRRALTEGETDRRVLNLSGSDLHGADLREARLGGADLSRSSFDYAQLDKADLRDADLRQSSFMEAYLPAADIRNQHEFLLFQTDFRAANLRGARFEGAVLWDTCFRTADLRKADLERADFRGANLETAQMFCANIGGATFINAKNLSYQHLIGAIGFEQARYPDSEDPRRRPAFQRERDWILKECLQWEPMAPRP